MRMEEYVEKEEKLVAARDQLFTHVLKYYRDHNNEEPEQEGLAAFARETLNRYGFEVTDELMDVMYDEYLWAQEMMLAGVVMAKLGSGDPFSDNSEEEKLFLKEVARMRMHNVEPNWKMCQMISFLVNGDPHDVWNQLCEEAGIADPFDD